MTNVKFKWDAYIRLDVAATTVAAYALFPREISETVRIPGPRRPTTVINSVMLIDSTNLRLAAVKRGWGPVRIGDSDPDDQRRLHAVSAGFSSRDLSDTPPRLLYVGINPTLCGLIRAEDPEKVEARRLRHSQKSHAIPRALSARTTGARRTREGDPRRETAGV